ncbi:conserved hypothetical protein [Tenacibaculum maritimum]|uniref:hypothetical protein n=1 Tax=Tenacibaculum maritimum TaxID=107401 RepID=UPI0012E4D879|nr:hypothetical protein [Tenacibaculum maritimum]CAA0153225.1 conserved hypothetical protein [Tenacibaculum maritimum]CAA0208055.1 conserved hypothetical protein [Tenacibaculum maritimum]
MNIANFQQIGGFPFETNTVDFMQKAYSIFNAFGALAGNKTIISGCEVQGNEITNGYIYLEGELLEFRGGIKQDTIVIIEEETKVEFEDQTVKGVYYTRYATFGVSGNSIPWKDFKRIEVLIKLLNRIKALEEQIALPATQKEVLDGVIRNKYVAPKTLPQNFVKTLYSKKHTIGNIPEQDWNTTINFPSVNTTNYLIVGNMVSKSGNPFYENDIAWVYYNKTATSFSISFREISGGLKNLEFHFSIISI